MKSNIVMKSADRNLFGTTIKQETKGEKLSVTDLQSAYNKSRFVYGWSERTVSGIMRGRDFTERCFYLLQERGFIKVQIDTFIEMTEKEGIVTVLKGLGVWATKGRGENKSVYCDPYIWVLLAMELNPMIYAKVVIWLTDSLIFNRIIAGTEYAPMNSAIKSIVPAPNYSKYAKQINMKVFGRHESGIRDTATQEQLRQIADIEIFITKSIKMGICKSENYVLGIIQNY